MEKIIKPLGHPAYGSIPHLPSSRLGLGDHYITHGQARIATERVRDRHDMVIVQEKLDGSCCSVANIGGDIIPLGRAGYPALTSSYRVHHIFHKWVMINRERFKKVLSPGERIVGEFLAQAVGTRYQLFHEPFVAFDLMTGNQRYPYVEFFRRIFPAGFIVPRCLAWQSRSFSLQDAIEKIQESGHGAIDPVEGVIYRVERHGKVDFLCKWVRHDKEDGMYFPEKTGAATVWNVNIEKYIPNILNQ